MKTYLSMAAIAGLSSSAVGQPWSQTSAPVTNWSAVVSSADGSKLAAAGTRDGIWISANSGGKWLQTGAPTEYWSCLASSADGSRLIAGVYYAGEEPPIGATFLSTNSGLQWTTNFLLPDNGWRSVASSADGSTLLALSVTGLDGKPQVFVSTNYGASWVATDTLALAVAASADGHDLAAPGTFTLLSTNSGNSWIPTQSFKYSVYSVASSADGHRLVAAGTNLYLSTNSGLQWVQAAAPSLTWGSVAASADGSRLVATAGTTGVQTGNGSFSTITNDVIYSSTNWGTTWTSNHVAKQDWASVASSADGGKLVAAVHGGGIWTAHAVLAPLLNVLPTNGNPKLSWVLPSTNFILQQSADLKNWGTLTNQPVLNLTNLQNELILPPPAGNGFYRLKNP